MNSFSSNKFFVYLLFTFCLFFIYFLFALFKIKKNKKNPDNTTVIWILIRKIVFIFLKIRAKFTLNE